MRFDPFDPSTWNQDRENCVIPPHEIKRNDGLRRLVYGPTARELAEADAREQAHIEAFFGGPEWRDEAQRMALEQMRKGRKSTLDAIRDAEEAKAMTDEEMGEELRRRAGEDWERYAGGETD